MLKTWSFWKTFFTVYLTLVAGIWGFVEAYTYFESDSLKQLLGSNWWILYYLLPLFIAFSSTALTNAKEETRAETLDQRNRRVMLDHVENFWVKGILEKSLHGAALLELGIREDPSAVSYPWTIKKEATNETLPAGKSMLEIFQEIGMGRSLLILGAPGSGKTTTLLELTRQLIERARQDETEPIPVVFNLASWKEKQTLADWLAEQLNILYYVPKKTAPAWVNENRMLLLLDGLDEVKADSRAKCVEVINKFREQHGLTSLVVCCRIEEYTAINTKLLFEGAITIQSLTSEQVNAYIDRFGNSLASVRLLLKKDKTLQELAETPLMLSIMTLAYKDRNADELIASENLEKQRRLLFDTYITRMFERSNRVANAAFSKQQTLHYLNWLARNMIQHNIITYQIEAMQPSWLKNQLQDRLYQQYVRLLGTLSNEITMVDSLKWSWKGARGGLILGLIIGLALGLSLWLMGGLMLGLQVWLSITLISGLVVGLSSDQIEETTRPGQRLRQTLFNSITVIMLMMLISGLLGEWIFGLGLGLSIGLLAGLSIGWDYGVAALIQHHTLRFVLTRNELLPWHLVSFLDHSVDLIFLRRVGGSYIFVHRLLMEHFAEMDV